MATNRQSAERKEKMMKRWKTTFAALLAALTIFPLAACSSQEDLGGSQGETPVPEAPIVPETPENTPTDTPADTPPVQTPQEPETPPKPTTYTYLRCTGNNVNLRSGAGTSFAVLGQAEENTMYAITGKVGNWYQTYYRGQTAYVYAEYAAVFSLPISQNEQVEDVLDEAYKHVGVPYVYGAVRLHDGYGNFLKGFTAQKFDCSSLVQYVYYQAAGKVLQTTTRTQVKQGKYVKRSELQRGDCLFFTNESREHLTGVERVGHVAIYLGNDYILHTASDYARIEKMSAKRWGYYLEARRFL